MISKLVLGLFSVGSLVILGAGVYHHDWYAGFGLVLFVTSLICNLAVYLAHDRIAG